MLNKIIDQIFRRAKDRSISVARFNFRGVGQSLGSFDHANGEQDDLLRVLRHLKIKHNVSLKDVQLIGYSFGSFVSARVAQKTGRLHRLSLIAPPTQWKNFPKLTTETPIDIYMPEHDEYTQPEHARAYYDTIEAPKRFFDIQGSDHFFVGRTKYFTDVFFESQKTS